ncbi:MAG: HAD family hydrolase [Clostridium sp.]|uniref:HAD family hydrolase n=1 Tax=Clostridium sp. TaxID=1506 RepID=UPI0030311549
MSNNKIDSIIFDLDGTMWDSSEQIVDTWNHVRLRYKEIRNEITVEDLKGVMGLQIKDIGKKFFPYLDEEKQAEILKYCCKSECEYLSEHGGKLYDNLEEILEKLSKIYKLFIVSNCQEGYIEAFLHAHKLDKYFIDFEHPGRTGLTKGENIKIVIERNNLKNPIYIGDTDGDCKAAKFAGIPFVYAKYGFGDVKEYDYKIDNLTEILALKF